MSQTAYRIIGAHALVVAVVAALFESNKAWAGLAAGLAGLLFWVGSRYGRPR